MAQGMEAMSGGAEKGGEAHLLSEAANALEATLYRMSDLSAIDPWIARIDRLLTTRSELFASPDTDRLACCIFAALTLRHPDHPRIDDWKARVLAIFDQHDDPTLRILCGFSLFVNGHLSGERGGMHHFCHVLQQLATRPEVAPQARIVERLVTLWYLGIKGEVDESLRAFEKGLALAEESGVHTWDGLFFIYAAVATLNKGDVETAGALLNRMEGLLDKLTPLDRVHFHHLRGWSALLENDLGRALFHQSRSLAGVQDLGLKNRIEGIAHFGMAVVLHEKGDTAKAREHLKHCREIGFRGKNRDLGYLCDLTEAQIALDDGRKEEAAAHLSAAMKVGRELAFLKFTYWRPGVMSRLCCFALREGIAVDFVTQMIRHFGLVPADPLWRLESWPWPVHVHTLGGFSVRIDGREVAFSAKAPRKSLELLKALIAFGPAPSEELLADLLWPHADGDAATRSLEITLHRLRRLLGEKTLIRRSEGRLLLDSQRIFVDVRTHEEIVGEAVGGGDLTGEEMADACRSLGSLYRGAFLQGEDDLEWALPVRRKLAQRYLQGVVALGRRCEERRFFDEAAVLYLQALEHEPQAEILYRRLLDYYLVQGRRPEALDLYRRYAAMLHSLGLTPDPETAARVHPLLIRTGETAR